LLWFLYKEIRKEESDFEKMDSYQKSGNGNGAINGSEFLPK